MTVAAGDKTLAELPIVAAESIPRLTLWDLTVQLLRRLCMGSERETS